jgi:hypothetical protein
MRLFGVPGDNLDFTGVVPFGIKTLAKQLPGDRDARLAEILVANTFVTFVMPALTSLCAYKEYPIRIIALSSSVSVFDAFSSTSPRNFGGRPAFFPFKNLRSLPGAPELT